MNDAQFNALIRLLDDNDPTVKAQVEAEIFRLGPEAIGRLEAASQGIADGMIQERIEGLISQLQTSHLTRELLEWRKQGGKDLLEGWMLVTQVGKPMLNVQKYRDAISRLSNRTWLQLSMGMSDLEKLCVLNKLLYNMEGFAGNYDTPEESGNFLLSEVLDQKKGNSLSMSMLYGILSDKLGIPLQVVNFQGYYALRYYSRNSHFYIDAYNKGLFFTAQQVTKFLQKLGANENVFSYKPLSNIYIVVQLIDALRAVLGREGSFDQAERFGRLQDDIAIRFDAAEGTSDPEA